MRLIARLSRRAMGLALCVMAVGVIADAPRSAQGQDRDAFYKELTEGDLVIARASLQEALEKRRSLDVGQWRNAATGASGSVMPTRTFRIQSGFFCRDYRETVLAAGALADRIGTACRDNNGVWIRVER